MANCVHPAGAARSNLGDSTLLIRKVAGYGLPGLFAKQCNVKVVRVQLPCLPLRWLDQLSKTIRLDGEADINSRF